MASVLSIGALGQTKLQFPTPHAPSTCWGAPLLMSDGSSVGQDFLLMAASNYYTLKVLAGHSYSVDVWDPFDATNGISPAIQIVAADCISAVNATDASNVDPGLSGGFSARVSWIQTSNATVHIAITNPDQNNSYTYYARVTDTTLFNPRWTTYSGFSTQWGLTNTTSSDVLGTFTVIDLDGSILSTVTNASVKAGVTTFFYTWALGLPPDHVGSATFAYIGPPGAILADAYYLNANATVVVPSFFASKHGYH